MVRGSEAVMNIMHSASVRSRIAFQQSTLISVGSLIGLIILFCGGIVLYYRNKSIKLDKLEKQRKDEEDSITEKSMSDESYKVRAACVQSELPFGGGGGGGGVDNLLGRVSGLSQIDETVQYLKNNSPNEIEHFVDETIAERMAWEGSRGLRPIDEFKL